MELYHYRSVSTALKEISGGTFYYADKSELNDPIEGYAQIYWQGDIPAWEGLFCNYICSLYYTIENYLLKARYEKIEKHAALLDIHSFDKVPLGDILNEVRYKFMSNPYIAKLVEYLGGQNIRISSKNLSFILRLIHEIAFSICMKSMKENQLIPQEQKEFYMPIEKILDVFFVNISSKLSDVDKKEIFEVTAGMLEDMIESRLMAERWGEKNEMPQQQVWLKIRLGFPLIYTGQLEEIIYPKGYVVCFSSDAYNSAMWGNYADDHRGVCLIYRTTSAEDKEIMQVKPVQYGAALIRRNGFESLGRLSYVQVESWLTAVDGRKSRLLSKYLDKSWVNTYWSDYEEKYCHKMSEWSYEKEYRLLLMEFNHEYTKEERLIKYEPDILTGVIFGIKTSELDKRNIIRAVKDSGRSIKDFAFYQAVYDDENQKITTRRKNIFLE